MRVFVVTPPDPVVTWAEAAAHLKIEGSTSEQDYVAALVAAATASIDGPDGWLGRALGAQTLEARFDRFCDPRILLRCPPVSAIVHIKYLDTNGELQTLSPADYELQGDTVVLAYNASWPDTLKHSEAVRIQYATGYDDLPAAIRAAILLMVGDLFRFRETVAPTAMARVPISLPVEQLLAPFRTYS